MLLAAVTARTPIGAPALLEAFTHFARASLQHGDHQYSPGLTSASNLPINHSISSHGFAGGFGSNSTGLEFPGELCVVDTCGASGRVATAERTGREPRRHIRGAMGYTWEHGLHLYLRRAPSSGLVLGRPAERRSWLVQALGL
jgi:hypothetical protein